MSFSLSYCFVLTPSSNSFVKFMFPLSKFISCTIFWYFGGKSSTDFFTLTGEPSFEEGCYPNIFSGDWLDEELGNSNPFFLSA